jgi:3-oxoacyl-[acyl-carrier protein] reductase
MSNELTLVCGASSDIGVALIQQLLAPASAGGTGTADRARVLAHHHASGERLAALGDRVVPMAADFSDGDAVDAFAARVLAEHGAPDELVYLPGLKLRYERFGKFDLAHFDRDLAVQVRSAIVLCKKLLPAMAKKPRAKVVFVLSSVTVGAPPRFMSMYTVVKHAQLGLMRALAAEYAATPLTVNAVSPAMIETRFLDDIPGLAKEMAAQASPRGRIATTADVVGTIAFLLSPASDFMTGANLAVTGGGSF